MKIIRRGKIFSGLIVSGMILAMATFGAQALAMQSEIPGWTIQDDGTYSDGSSTCADSDEDSYYDNTCIEGSMDCDDFDNTINPGATEICGDDIDQDCSGADEVCVPGPDDDQPGETCDDSDEDDYYTNTCYGSTDCNDSNSAINPNASEICSDSIDNNCDGQEDEWCPDSCSEADNFFSCLSSEISTNLSTVLTSGLTTLKSSIQSLLTTASHPASIPSGGKISSSFDRLSIGEMAGLNPANSDGFFLINNAEIIGSAFVNENVSGISVGIASSGTVGAVGMGTTTGVLVEKYTNGVTTISPKIGISAQASDGVGIGLYAFSSGETGTNIQVSDLGLYSIGRNVGIVSKGTTTGISVTAANSTYGNIIGAVTHDTSKERAWGALGYTFKGTNYSLFTPFSAYSDTLEVVGDTESDTLKAETLRAEGYTGFMEKTTLLDTISANGVLTVQKPLAMSGDLGVNRYLDIDGNVTVENGGSFKMNGDLTEPNHDLMIFDNDVQVSSDSGSSYSAKVDGRVTATDGIGTFYQMKGYNNLGNPKVSCRSGDFLVSCSAKVENSADLYVGARPQNSTTCEAYAQKSNVTVTVYAYCFDPQGTASSSL